MRSLYRTVVVTIETTADILEKEAREAVEASGEEVKEFSKSLSQRSRNTAQSVVSSLMGEHTKQSCLNQTQQKIKSFFVLCFAESCWKKVLRRLCCHVPQSSSSVENILEEASPVLKELVKEEALQQEQCLYRRLSQDIQDRQFEKLSEHLAQILSDNMAAQEEQEELKEEVRPHVDSFMSRLKTWLHLQQSQTPRQDPVRRALAKIHTLTVSMGQQRAPRLPPTPPPPSDARVSVAGAVCATEPAAQTLVASGPSPGSEEWNRFHMAGLVYEVVSLVLQTDRFAELKSLSEDLLQELRPEMSRWNIRVRPDVCSIREAARAVYSHLCQDRQRNWVTLDAMIGGDYIGVIVHHIRKHLIAPTALLPSPSPVVSEE
uniref:Uncharacterized protein n=1 Tax=Knipowitschia caucasica TaxID=637954 RepID=A0AAV2M253_KNICA